MLSSRRMSTEADCNGNGEEVSSYYTFTFLRRPPGEMDDCLAFDNGDGINWNEIRERRLSSFSVDKTKPLPFTQHYRLSPSLSTPLKSSATTSSQVAPAPVMFHKRIACGRAQHRGMLDCRPDKLELLVERLLEDLAPEVCATLRPRCLPAHVLLMCQRYFDREDDRSRLYTLYGIVHRTMDHLLACCTDVLKIAHSLSLMTRWMQLMRQYSGLEIYSIQSTDRQYDHCFIHFNPTNTIERLNRSVVQPLLDRLLAEICANHITDLVRPALLDNSTEHITATNGHKRNGTSKGLLPRIFPNGYMDKTADQIKNPDHLTSLITKLSYVYELLALVHADWPLVELIFQYVFHALSNCACDAFLLSAGEYATPARGMQIKYNLSFVFNWCSDRNLDVIARRQLKALCSIANILILNKVYQDDHTVDSIVNSCEGLTISEVDVILSAYHDENVNHLCGNFVILVLDRLASDPIHRSQQRHPPHFELPFVASDVHLDTVELPNNALVDLSFLQVF